jgi:hypothetical protein
MKFITLQLFALVFVMPFGFTQNSTPGNSSGLTTIFQEDAHAWTAKQKRLINRVVKKIRKRSSSAITRITGKHHRRGSHH